MAQADKKIHVENDLDGALLLLNRAYAIDPDDATIGKKITDVYMLKEKQQPGTEQPVAQDVVSIYVVRMLAKCRILLP